jgi:aspartate-semialdehyde dehydrogenase
VDKSSASACRTLKPLNDAAGLARVRVSTYQSVSRAGRHRMDELRATLSAEGNLAMDWDFEGEEFDEESKLRAETCKIVELPERPIRATCVRVPVLVSRAEAVWVETEEPLSGEEARDLLSRAPGIRLQDFATPRRRWNRRRPGGSHPARPDRCERSGLLRCGRTFAKALR